GLAVGAPVDVADLITGIILAMLGELDAEALVGALVDAGEEALDHVAGHHGQAAVLGQGSWIKADGRGWHVQTPPMLAAPTGCSLRFLISSASQAMASSSLSTPCSRSSAAPSI